MAETISAGNVQVRRNGLAAFQADVVRNLDRARIREGYGLLGEFRMALLDDDVLAQRGYLTADGEWDSSFRTRHSQRDAEPLQRISLPSGGQGVLSLEQSRIFQEVRAAADDHMHVQGYAGTGKSYLIGSLLSMLETTGAEVLVLAARHRQMQALLPGLGGLKRVHPRTFDQLMREMVPSDLSEPINRRLSRANYSLVTLTDDSVARHLGVQPTGRFSPQAIVKMVRGTVAGFCYSGDAQIDAQHIPEWCFTSLDTTTCQVVLHHATELWKATLLPPSRDFQPPVRGFHRIKWAALNRWQIPVRYTHVVIDECHDLPKPMLQILDSSPQAVVSLGDEYQNLQGRPQQRANVVRQRVVTHSLRAGNLLETFVNPLIAAHPGKTKLPFHGNSSLDTEVLYYERPEIPDQPAAILVNDTWGLFEWAQRATAAHSEVVLLSSRNALDMFVKDCIELYRHGTRPRHGELFRFGQWQDVAARYHDNRGFQRIDRMLANGYSETDWMRTAARLTDEGPRRYAVGLIEDVRNREFDAVMLVPDVLDRVWNAQRSGLATTASAIYVAVTRARRRLIVPTRLRSWLEEIGAAPSSAGNGAISSGLQSMQSGFR